MTNLFNIIFGRNTMTDIADNVLTAVASLNALTQAVENNQSALVTAITALTQAVESNNSTLAAAISNLPTAITAALETEIAKLQIPAPVVDFTAIEAKLTEFAATLETAISGVSENVLHVLTDLEPAHTV